MSHNGVGKPTINGIVKGRPGKGKVLSLGQRAACYSGHRMTPENTFTYHKRIWCRQCRADSRNRSRNKRLAEARAVAQTQRKTASDKLNAAFEKAHVKEVKASAPKLAESKPVKAKTPKMEKAPIRPRKAEKPKKVKLAGQARIDAELAAFSARKAAA